MPVILGMLLLGVSFLSGLQPMDWSDFSLQFVQPTVRPSLGRTVASLGLAKDGWGLYKGVLTNQGVNTTDPALTTAILGVLRNFRCTPDRLEGEQRLGCAVIIRDSERRWCERECSSWYGLEFRVFPIDAGKKNLIVQLPSTYCGSGGCTEQLYIKRKDGWRVVVDVFGVIEIAPTHTNGLPELIIDGQFRLVWDGVQFVAKAL